MAWGGVQSGCVVSIYIIVCSYAKVYSTVQIQHDGHIRLDWMWARRGRPVRDSRHYQGRLLSTICTGLCVKLPLDPLSSSRVFSTHLCSPATSFFSASPPLTPEGPAPVSPRKLSGGRSVLRALLLAICPCSWSWCSVAVRLGTGRVAALSFGDTFTCADAVVCSNGDRRVRASGMTWSRLLYDLGSPRCGADSGVRELCSGDGLCTDDCFA
jgi:hypothetical protein